MDAARASGLDRTSRSPRSRAARGRCDRSRKKIFPQAQPTKEKAVKEPSATLIPPSTVRLERLLPGPVERVWSYITESKKRATWLAAGEFDLRIGGKIELHFENDKLP